MGREGIARPAAGGHPSRPVGSVGRLRLGPGPSGPGFGVTAVAGPLAGRGESRGSAFGRLTRPAGRAGPLDETATIGAGAGCEGGGRPSAGIGRSAPGRGDGATESGKHTDTGV